MNTFSKKISVLLILLTLSFLIFCDGKPKRQVWNYNLDDVVRPAPTTPDSIRIDLYIDATLSMQGFVSNSQSKYIKFIDELRTTSGVAWRSVDERYFKFGTKIKEIDLNEFKNFHNKSFYHEPGIYEKTNIDLVIDQTDISRVSVVLTDLFQDEGDILSIEQQIMNKCFTNGVQVAILGVQSQFSGNIYDLGKNTPPYYYASSDEDESTYRPFYALMFGDPDNIEHLFNNLSTVLPFVDESKFLVLSNFLVDKLSVKLNKKRECRSLNARKSGEKFPQHFNIVLRDGYESGEMEFDINVHRNPKTPDFNEQNMLLSATRKKIETGRKNTMPAATPSKDISLIQNSISRNENHLTGDLKLVLPDEEGSYTYKIYLECARLGGLKIPDWIQAFSSPNPSANNAPNKTRNLESFVSALIRANLTINQPKIAKFYVTVRKM